MIGFLCCSTLPYYDFAAKQNKFKIRPVLIIGRADTGDYNVLPVSRVTNKQFIHPFYDIPSILSESLGNHINRATALSSGSFPIH